VKGGEEIENVRDRGGVQAERGKKGGIIITERGNLLDEGRPLYPRGKGKEEGRRV